MVRKIVDYKKLNKDILNLLVEKFPDGYDDQDIISFRNASNEVVEAVEIRTDDTIYLVKIGKRLVKAMEDFEDESDEDEDSSDKGSSQVDLDDVEDDIEDEEDEF